MSEKEIKSSDELAEARRKAADEAANIRYLAPGDFIIFEQDGAIRLTIPDDRTYLKVAAFRTFPLSQSEKYISLRSGMEEIGIMRDIKEFDKKTQNIIRELLRRRYFVPRVKKIVGTRERYGGMVWDLLTDRGAKTIITKGLHEALSENSSGCYFITDVEGNRYEVPIDEESADTIAWIEEHI